ncbi:MAG: hypothetical protein Fues2KO_32220 [Fuerstiella sp.]
MTRRPPLLCLSLLTVLLMPNRCWAELQAGAAIVDVTPKKFPVLVNGGMTSRSATDVVTPINARAIVVSDGTNRIGIVVVDSCMMPRQLLDEAKQLASRQTQLKPDHILISATHTHTAPSSMGALGTDADEDYLPVLRAGIVEALVLAEQRLEPAVAGWGSTDAGRFTALRRWIKRPDRVAEDPFGNPTVRATMHAGGNWDDVVGESGPEDPELAMISFRSKSGHPIAVLANFSMHYFSGQKPLAADYFGLFCDGFQQRVTSATESATAEGDRPPFVAIMSHGCSGDIWRRDYTQPKEQQDPFANIQQYADELLDVAHEAWQQIEYETHNKVQMAEQRLQLNYRVPDQQRLEWAQRIVAETGDRLPKTRPEIYAREQLFLHERQSAEVVVQGLRIGDMAIATTPNETYALTGLKIKKQSPLAKTMVIELANGGDGYIPPPEQHLLGGYNTWAARSAGLEVLAEPKITASALHLLEQVSQQPRQVYRQPQGPAARSITQLNPIVWYRLDEFAGPMAADSSGHNHHAAYEPTVAYFLAGPHSKRFCNADETNRSVHFVDDRLIGRVPVSKDQYTVSMWFWNGLPNDVRPVAGWMYSRGPEHGLSAASEHLGLAGAGDHAGRLIFQTGDNDQQQVTGSTAVNRWAWNHVTLVRDGKRVQIYLNGKLDIETESARPQILPSAAWFFAGRCDNQSNWEGRLDEIAIFDRPLTEQDVAKLNIPTNN